MCLPHGAFGFDGRQRLGEVSETNYYRLVYNLERLGDRRWTPNCFTLLEKEVSCMYTRSNHNPNLTSLWLTTMMF